MLFAAISLANAAGDIGREASGGEGPLVFSIPTSSPLQHLQRDFVVDQRGQGPGAR